MCEYETLKTVQYLLLRKIETHPYIIHKNMIAETTTQLEMIADFLNILKIIGDFKIYGNAFHSMF